MLAHRVLARLSSSGEGTSLTWKATEAFRDATHAMPPLHTNSSPQEDTDAPHATRTQPTQPHVPFFTTIVLCVLLFTLSTIVFSIVYHVVHVFNVRALPRYISVSDTFPLYFPFPLHVRGSSCSKAKHGALAL